MNTILLREKVTPEEFTFLLTEFPQYQILVLGANPLSGLTEEQCRQVEILYGKSLRAEEFTKLPQIRWIHSPDSYIDDLCTEKLIEHPNILITTTKDENVVQVGEFALSATLAFAKNLFQWQQLARAPGDYIEHQLREAMWTLSNRIFLQIGLGTLGTEIAKRAKDAGFKVLGISDIPSFHPACHKTYSMEEMYDLLPQADIVSISMPRDKLQGSWFGKTELNLLKDDVILLVFGANVIPLQELERYAKSHTYRGILLDAHLPESIPPTSPIWSEKKVLITHESGYYPKSTERHSFKTFVYNLRQFLHGNFTDMKNVMSFT